MYPNSQHVDEPTMTDLRGVLPGQRPPVDARVLDEPTSEVPIIRPAGMVDPDPEPEASVTDTEFEVADEEPAAATADQEPEASVTDAEPEAEMADPEPEAEMAGAEPEADMAEPATEEEPATPAEQPEPTFTPPLGPAFGAGATAATPGSEMAKMSWAPAPPPGLVPVDSTSRFEPAPLAEVTEVDEEARTEPAVEPEPIVERPEPVAAVEPEPVLEQPEPVAVVEPEPDPVAVTEPAAPEPAPETPPAQPGPSETTETPAALWSDETAQRLRDQWRDLQVQFIDDPNAAVTGAKDLVTEAVQQLAETLLAAQAELDPFREGDRADTEAMRVAMRRYREFLDRVLAL